jgi:GDP-D-mannose dehydratase
MSQDHPHDFVIATGAPYSGRQFVVQFVKFAAV